MRKYVFLSFVIVVLALVACSPEVNPLQGPTATPVVQTRVVRETVQVPQTVVVRPTSVPATSVPAVATAAPTGTPTTRPTATSVPLSAMPSGWSEVEVTTPQCTLGRRLVFNHNADGKITDVFLTWGNVEVVGDNGQVTQNLGKVIRVTQDPLGERLAMNGGWRKFRFRSQPTQADVDALVNWAKGALVSNATFACNAVGDYATSLQAIANAPRAAVANTEPLGWSEVPLNPKGDSFVPAGDVLTQDSVDHKGNRWLTAVWFWAGPNKPTGNDGCTVFVITNTGQTNFWFQGARRTWQISSGNPTSSQIREQVKWIVEKLLEVGDYRGGCNAPGKYTVIWQDPALAPANAKGRP